MLHNIRIVLVETSHTGNIGSTARAMKTMGLNNLYLVNPLHKPDSQAIALSAGTSDIIGNATLVDNLDQALAGCSLVVGTSARSRTLPWRMLEPRKCGVKSVQEAAQAPVALLFGRERVGLTNDELQKCHFHVQIPANPEYSSLNLAMAVQILAYKVRVAWLESQRQDATAQEASVYPLAEDLERFYQHMEHVLSATGFIRRAHPGLVMNKLLRLFNRARPESQELNILRGMLTSIEHPQTPLADAGSYRPEISPSRTLTVPPAGMTYPGCRQLLPAAPRGFKRGQPPQPRTDSRRRPLQTQPVEGNKYLSKLLG